ncbi:MAG: Radical domain protein [Oscillospiraceae bacterium]|nr:Radical domain protein [Oscillospiraceae bacterium]
MKRFKKAYIEITNVCNLDCSFCKKTKRAPGFLSLNQFEFIINQVRNVTEYIYLHLLGEPLLHPNLFEFLRISDDAGLKTSITTNGTLIKEQQKMLMDANNLYKISFSLHSFEASLNQQNIEDYIKDICCFSKTISENQGTICVLRLWNLNSNQKIFSVVENFFGLKEPLKQHFTTKNSIKLGYNVFMETAQRFSWPTMDIDALTNKGFCYGLRDQIGIHCDGTVVPCCLDSEGDINLGNIFDDNLENIMNSDRARAIYDGFSNRQAVEPLCQRCGYMSRF